MNVKELFSGIVVIIDNEVDKTDSEIYKIKENIQKVDIPVATYNNIPSTNVVSSLTHASFIILDWDYDNVTTDFSDIEERVMGGPALGSENQQVLLDFIKSILKNIFVPVFIFTALNPEGIKETLIEEGIIHNGKSNRVFVKQKNEVSSEAELFNSIGNWLKEMPSVYVLKEWENIFSNTKNNMFLEWYQYSPNWVSVIWDMLKSDSNENEYEFGNFITKNLINRINAYSFKEDILDNQEKPNKDELYRIMEHERYLKYGDNQPNQIYTGDLFKDTDEQGKPIYYLNIRAQCDLARAKDAELYVINGRPLNTVDIITNNIRISSEGDLVFSENEKFSLENINEICKKAQGQDTTALQEINEKFDQHRNKIYFGHGELLEKKPEAIIACVDNGMVIKFRLDIRIKKFKQIKEKRIGRILPPYINRIQQKTAQYIVREGVMPIPEEMFVDYQ